MRILTWSVERILNEVKGLDRQSLMLREDLYRMAWYMRGSLTADEIFAMCPEDRNILAKIIKENLDTTKKSGMPFF